MIPWAAELPGRRHARLGRRDPAHERIGSGIGSRPSQGRLPHYCPHPARCPGPFRSDRADDEFSDIVRAMKAFFQA